MSILKILSIPCIRLVSFFMFLVFSQVPISAQTMYVQPSSEVAVRRGQGTDFKIIAMAKDGLAVEVMEQNDSYARVRLPNEKEGWMLKRFLSEQPPLQEVVAMLRAEKNTLTLQKDEAIQNFKDISFILTQKEKELQSILVEKDRIQTAYQKLQKDTADTVQIKNAQLKTAEENKTLVKKLNAVEQRSNTLEKDHSIKWFLSGGSVLLIGMFIGIITSRSRKRKPSLY